LLADASVARNFAVLGWTDELIALAGGSLSIAHGVLGMDCNEVGEIERIRAAFDNESIRSPGSPMASAATAALVGLDDLIRRRSKDVAVLAPTEAEMAVAIRLQDPREGRGAGPSASGLEGWMRVRRSRSRSPPREGSPSRPTMATGALPTRPSLAPDTVGRWTSSKRRPLMGC
jgi:hypothetical protein